MPHTLPDLPYANDALEPHIDARTMDIHRTKHHNAYVTNLNAALDKHPELHKKSLEDLCSDLNGVPEDIRGAVRNNGGGHLNHSMFWTIMKKDGGGEPKDDLARDIIAAFVSFAAFKEKFTNAGMTRFGSGWAWLVIGKSGKLEVTSTASQDNPLMEGQKPVMGVDVWEHAYYLKYQNLRKNYLDAWWNVANWEAIAARYGKLK